MEAIITIVGFLGAGKTTLLKHLMNDFLNKGWNPFIILNDYENANLDIEQFMERIDPKWVRSLSGSCICCSGINDLRNFVNNIPERKNGITLIEANGTSDACSLMGFLGVGIESRFLPPVQVSVVDVKNWQQRGEHNELESNQIQVSSMIILTHVEHASTERKNKVVEELKALNPLAQILNMDELDTSLLTKLSPSENKAQEFEHLKAHWSSCSVNLPDLPDLGSIHHICQKIPKSVLRVKGCTRVDKDGEYTYFERTPDGEIHIRPFRGIPTTGPKLLAVGPGSDPNMLESIVEESIIKGKQHSSE